MKPYGIVDILQYFLIRTPTHVSVVGWARHERHGVHTERDFELGGSCCRTAPGGDDQQRA